MEYIEPKIFFKSIEVAVIVEQLMAFLKAKGGNQAVDCAANCNSTRPQFAKVLRRSDCQSNPACIKNRKFHEIALEFPELHIGTNPLQNFAQNEAGQSDLLFSKCLIQPDGMAIGLACKSVNPYGAIDNHHAC